MHARHRSPGNGYRPGSMGMGLASARISPDGSARGHGFYNAEFRSFNRGFGRGQGQPKPYQQPQAPPRKGDIFVEAGRLAAEYLVSQGLLPPNVLSGKWQNGSFKNKVTDFQEFRSPEGDNLYLPPEGRTSALARLGNANSDAGLGRRRFSDDDNLMGLRNHAKGRRRAGFFRYGSDWGRENGRSGSWSDRARASPEMEGDNDSFPGHQEEQQVSKDAGGGVQKFNPSESDPKTEDTSTSESKSEKYQFQDDMDSKAGSSTIGKDASQEMDRELTKRSDDVEKLNKGTGEVKEDIKNDKAEKPSAAGELSIQQCAVEGEPTGKNSSDLLSLCKFAKVPTKTRSSLTCRGLKVEAVPNTGEENTLDTKFSGGSGVPVEDNRPDGSSVDALSNMTHDLKCLDPEISKALSIQSAVEAGELDSLYGAEQGKCLGSQSFTDRVFMYEHDQESSQGPPGFQSSSSMVKERGEKRASEDNTMRDGNKKPREGLPSMVTKSDEYFNLSNLSEKKLSSQEERASPVEKVTVEQEGLATESQFLKGDVESCVKYAQEQQFFPSSFKICDLNLMEASDLNENHHGDPILLYHPIPEIKKEAAQVDIDLSISNSNMCGEYSRRTADGKEIEVIDLENDSVQEDNAFENLGRMTEPAFSGLDGFSNHAQNAGEMPDVQDNYDGLTISEFLSAFPNCNPVPEDVNPLQNQMGLHNGEETLGDDDSIYMSLDEIPISFMRSWGQPHPQEYEKPF